DIASVAAMIDDGAAQFAAFLADPDQITLRLAPATPVRLSENTVDDFARFALLMQPEVITGTPPVAQVVTGADMEAIKGWLDGDEAALASSDALRMARAFMTGIGVPRDADMAMRSSPRFWRKAIAMRWRWPLTGWMPCPPIRPIASPAMLRPAAIARPSPGSTSWSKNWVWPRRLPFRTQARLPLP
ncbi:MAG: hypothetical protein P8X66_11395, partial [Maritimibacter sp.]